MAPHNILYRRIKMHVQNGMSKEVELLWTRKWPDLSAPNDTKVSNSDIMYNNDYAQGIERCCTEDQRSVKHQQQSYPNSLQCRGGQNWNFHCCLQTY